MTKPAKQRPTPVLVDEFYTTREERYGLDRKSKKLKSVETGLKEQILEQLTASKHTTGVSGKVASATLVDKEEFIVEDWDLLEKWILKTKDFGVLQRRLSSDHVKELANEGVKIPGVSRAKFKDLSFSKVS